MKAWIIIGAVLAGISVISGAFGAHGLKPKITPHDLAIYETAVHYHMIHALALILLGLIGFYFNADVVYLPGIFILTGILIFSGSLYTLVLTNLRWFGAITPIGGVSFVIGWGLLAYNLWRNSGS